MKVLLHAPIDECHFFIQRDFSPLDAADPPLPAKLHIVKFIRHIPSSRHFLSLAQAMSRAARLYLILKHLFPQGFLVDILVCL
jgi:hypothetical protein